MIDKAKVSQAVKDMTANPDWADVLFNAPGGAQLRIELAFYASKNLDSMNQQEKDEYREFREMLESQLSAGELKYLTEAFGRMGVDAAQQHYQELFSKKTPEEQQQGNQEYEAIKNKTSSGGGENESSENSQNETPDEAQEESKQEDESGDSEEGQEH